VAITEHKSQLYMPLPKPTLFLVSFRLSSKMILATFRSCSLVCRGKQPAFWYYFLGSHTGARAG